MSQPEALYCDIFKHEGQDCSNGGISSRFEEVQLLIGGSEDVLAQLGPFTEQGTPRVRLIKRELRLRDGSDGEYLHAEPNERPAKGRSGYMNGGTFITTSDSRFPHDYPIKLHDRTE